MPVQRGPGPSFPLLFPEDHALVKAAPMLGWQSVSVVRGQPALVQLEVFQALRAFIGRCELSTSHNELSVLNGVSFLEFDMTDAAWNRVFDEYLASGLIDALEGREARNLEALDGATRSITISNPDNLVIRPQDIQRRDSFDSPAAPAQRRGAGGAQPAVNPAIPGPAEQRFLEECKLPLLEDRDGLQASLWPLAYLAGMMGPVGVRAARVSAVSSVQLTSAMVSRQLTTRFGCTTDGAKAVNLKDFLKDTYLPGALAAPTATEGELRREARDACLYRGSEQGRVDVEISRLSLLRFR